MFRGRLLAVHVDTIETADGTRRTRELVAHPGAAAILPVLPDGNVLLVRQYRHPVRRRLWEIPAGKLEPGESPLSCARRELREETGHTGDRWVELASFFTSPGFSDERIVLFLATGLRSIAPRDVDEIAEMRSFTLDEIDREIAAGRIEDAKTILAIGRMSCHGAAV